MKSNQTLETIRITISHSAPNRGHYGLVKLFGKRILAEISRLRGRSRDKVTAIKALKEIEAEDRLAIPAEQKILVKLADWGRLPEIPRWWKRGSALLTARRFFRANM